MLRLFFRRIEVVGSERLPEGGILLAPNHPNALVDPLVVLALSERPVSFLGKAPLFTTPVVGSFVKALDALPVYRAQDGYDTSKNKETLLAARRILDKGGAICIFPEGKSHDEPSLEKLKTGPARIALGARASGASVHVVPCGIFYTQKETFRSDCVYVYGEPLEVPQHELDDDGEPPFEVAKELTARLKVELDELLVQGESHELLGLVARAARVVRGAQHDQDPDASMTGEAPTHGRVEDDRQLRQLILRGYEHWRDKDPARVASLAARVEVLDDLFGDFGLHASRVRSHEGGRRWTVALTRMVLLVVSAPVAVAAAIVHWLPYRGCDLMARKMAKGDGTVVSTMKLLAGLLFFPLWWSLAAVGLGLGVGWVEGAASFLALPALAAAAMYWFEGLDRWRAWARAVSLRVEKADVHAFMIEERQSIYDELVEMGEAL